MKKLKLAHPGKMLRSFMTAYGLSTRELARRLHIGPARLNRITMEKASISPNMSLILEAYFGFSEGYWLRLQHHYDLEMAKDKIKAHLRKIVPHDELSA